jgi:hypothetical protein
MQFDGFSGYADVVTRGSNAAAGCHAADMLVGVISRPITGRPFTDTFQCHSSLAGVSVDVYADRSIYYNNNAADTLCKRPAQP